jgi:hypothetical protein
MLVMRLTIIISDLSIEARRNDTDNKRPELSTYCGSGHAVVAVDSRNDTPFTIDGGLESSGLFGKTRPDTRS